MKQAKLAEFLKTRFQLEDRMYVCVCMHSYVPEEHKLPTVEFTKCAIAHTHYTEKSNTVTSSQSNEAARQVRQERRTGGPAMRYSTMKRPKINSKVL